jgi:hypothetical protein
MDSLLRRVLCPVFGLSLASCASVSEPHERFAHQVVRSDPAVLSTAPVGVKLVKEGRWSTPDTLSVAVEQQVGCEDGFRDTVATTRTVTRETKNVGVQALGGGLLVLSGGVVLAGASTLSNEIPEGEESSPRGTAVVWGALGLAGGAVLLGHALYVAARGSDETSAPYNETVRRSAGKPLRVCSRAPAGRGMVRGRIGERAVAVAFTQTGGEVTVRPRESALRLCGDPADADREAVIDFVLGEDEDLTVELGRYPLKRCVTVTVATKRLMAAEATASNASDAEAVAWAAEGVSEAEKLVQSLATTDPERPALVARVLSARRKTAARVAELVEPATQKALQAIRTDFANSVPPTTLALRLAHLSSDGTKTWSSLYEAFTARAREDGILGYGQVHRLLQADTATRSCLTGSAACSNGLTANQVRTALSPFAVVMGLTIRKQAEELRAATAKLARKVDPTGVKESDAVKERMQAFRDVCAHRELLDAVKHACTELAVADETLASETRAKSDEIARVRAEVLETEHSRATARATKRWREHFSACQRLRGALAQVNAVSSCDSTCQQVRSRIHTEEIRLRAVRIEDPIHDASFRTKLQNECTNAGCEVCPE